MRQNVGPRVRLLLLGDVHRTDTLDCSVSPTRSIQEGLILRERVLDSIYALTWRNRIVAGFFIVLATAQIILGVVFLSTPENACKAPNSFAAYSRILMTSLPPFP